MSGRSLDRWPHVIRAVRWQPLVACGALAPVLSRGRSALEVTVAATTLAIGASFAFDDPAATTLASSPTTLLRRRALHVAVVVPLAAVLWWCVVSPLAGSGEPAADLEAATLVALAGALAASAARRSAEGVGSVVAAPALIGLVAAASFLPPRWGLYPVDRHARAWVVLVGAAVVALVVASRDPAS